jgi:hypothetical protein
MDLNEFRELTKNMPGDVELIIAAKHNPCGNCWSVLSVEATSISSFGVELPALKLAESDPDWVDGEGCGSLLSVNPKSGQWAANNDRAMQSESNETRIAHTPGPWKATNSSSAWMAGFVVLCKDGREVAGAWETSDARLIAESTEMLKVIEIMANATGDTDLDHTQELSQEILMRLKVR